MDILYVQQTQTECKFGLDGGTVSGPGLAIHLEGRSSNRGSFVHLGGTKCGDGSSDTDICRRITAGANVWQKAKDDGM